MITVIGVLFLFAAIYCYVKSAESLFALLIFSSLFPATAAIAGDQRWLPPYYIIACFFIVKSYSRKLLSDKSAIEFDGKSALIVFCCIAVTSAIAYPLIFKGIPVYSPQVGIDDGMFDRPPLSLGLGNIGQAGYLVIQALVVFSASRLRVSAVRSSNAYWYACYFLVVIIFVQFACKQAGVSFPYTIIQNNPYVAQAMSGGNEGGGGRVPGTFSEPSTAGTMLAAYALGMMSQCLSGKPRWIAILLSWLAIGMVASTSSLVAVALTTLLLILSKPVFRFPWYIRLDRAKPVALLLIVGAIVAMGIAMSPMGTTIFSQTASKQESLSYINRLGADEYAMELVKETHGIGVGLGSNRPSSLVASLLSNVGIVGFVVFVVMCVQLLKNVTGTYAWIRWAASALLIDLVSGGPDITSPLLWTLLTMSVWFGTYEGLAPSNSSGYTSPVASN